jgi:hypothetical protein
VGGLNGVGGEHKVVGAGGGEAVDMDEIGKDEDQGGLV